MHGVPRRHPSSKSRSPASGIQPILIVVFLPHARQITLPGTVQWSNIWAFKRARTLAARYRAHEQKAFIYGLREADSPLPRLVLFFMAIFHLICCISSIKK